MNKFFLNSRHSSDVLMYHTVIIWNINIMCDSDTQKRFHFFFSLKRRYYIINYKYILNTVTIAKNILQWRILKKKNTTIDHSMKPLLSRVKFVGDTRIYIYIRKENTPAHRMPTINRVWLLNAHKSYGIIGCATRLFYVR